MKTTRILAAFLLSAVSSACYHQVIDTGVAPGNKSIEKPWTSTWIFGLVEAKPIDVRAECPGGVAIVDTKMSFANGIAGMLTIGIWTPLSVTVRCAGATASAPAGRAVHAAGDVAAALTEAISLSRRERSEVVLDWRASTQPIGR